MLDFQEPFVLFFIFIFIPTLVTRLHTYTAMLICYAKIPKNQIESFTRPAPTQGIIFLSFPAQNNSELFLSSNHSERKEYIQKVPTVRAGKQGFGQNIPLFAFS